MPQRNLLILLIAAAVSYTCYVCAEQNPYARYVARGLAEIEDSALKPVPNEQLFNDAMVAMVDALHQQGDEHSQFISRKEADPFRDEIRQQFGGIGVRIRFAGDPPQLMIFGAPEPDTPAARTEIRAGDHVLKIDGRPTAGMSLSEVLNAIRGEPGQPVRLSIRHPGDQPTIDVELVREVIQVDSILGDRRNKEGGWEFRLQNDPRIAQVRVTTFGNKTVDELNQVLERLTSEGVDAVVLDLRDDAGGALDTAVAICDLFLPPRKPIVEIRGRHGVVDERYLTDGKGPFQKLPLAVLVNQNSASASEIVAACLQDNDRAVVLGQRSYGKGTVQKLVPMESGRSLLKITSASYWRPSGKNIHRSPGAADSDDWGVSPNPGYEVPLTSDQYDEYRNYRDTRDLWGLVPEGGVAEIDRDRSPRPETPFVDRQLEAAVDYLQGVLEQQRR
jgi:carboxyl-terminal processing protease